MTHSTHLWLYGVIHMVKDHSDSERERKPIATTVWAHLVGVWCNKGCGMCCPVCGMANIKDPLLLIEKINP